MQFIVDTLLYPTFGAIGGLVKRLFGRKPSESGNSEMWIGTLVCVAAIAMFIWLRR